MMSEFFLKRFSVERFFRLIPPISVLLTWALLYLPYLRTSPGWYGDETGALILARNLAEGSLSLGSLKMSFLHTYFPIQPGYLIISGIFASAFDGDILGARFFNVLLALSIALLIYFKGRFRFGCIPTWFGAIVFLTFSQSIIHFRWIYPHNAVALGVTIALLFLIRPVNRKNDWLAGCGLAIASASHPLFIHGALAAVLCRLKFPFSWIRMAIPPLVVVVGTFLFITCFYWPQKWLTDDLNNLWFFYSNSSQTAITQSNLIFNFYKFYSQDFFHFLSLLCIFLCILSRSYAIAIYGIVISMLLLQNRQNLPTFYYQAIVLAPVYALAWANALSIIGRKLRNFFPGKRLDRIFYGLSFFLLVLSATAQLPDVLRGKLTSKNHFWVTQSIEEVESCANWINKNTDGDALVIANTNIAWLLRAKAVDFFQTVLWLGYPTEYFQWGISRERFIFPIELTQVQFAIIGDIDHRWTLHQKNVDVLLRYFTDENWPIVWRGQTYIILRNPNYEQAIH